MGLLQVEISKGYGKTEWREDVKKCLLKAGIEDKPIVFLFSDVQIVNEIMLEDINGECLSCPMMVSDYCHWKHGHSPVNLLF